MRGQATFCTSERPENKQKCPFGRSTNSKVPLKVAEYIRKDVPFAALVPLSLLNEIDRTGKNSIDEIVRDKRSRMKLVISTSLGQAWLINHPSCNLTTSRHSVFFTESPDDEALQGASNAVLHSWYAESLTSNGGDTLLCAKELSSCNLCELVVGAIDRLMIGGMNQDHDNFAQITPREMRARKRGKPLLPDDQSESQGGTGNTPLDQSEINIESVEIEPPTLDQDETECQRISTHPLHTISTGPAPLPIEQWPSLQDPEDKPSNMVQVPKEELKRNMPHDLIVFRDGNGRQRILVPKCQRTALTQTEHETMLHVKGPRVLHELSRSYFWPHMAEEIKQLCNACGVCKRSQIQRLNLSSIFRQA